jgi:hypothetical protein
VDKAEHVVEGIRQFKSKMDEFEYVHMEIHVSINSQTGMFHSLFNHFSIDHDA